MNMKNNLSLIFLFIILIFGAFLLTGCGGKEDIGAYGHDRVKDQSHWAKGGEDVPDLTLADGQILAVRLVYDPEEESSDTDWYKVQLSRIGKAWKDSVKIEGIIRSKNRHYDDYVFSAKNFNWQVEKEQYDINTLNGEYEITIQGSNGYNKTYKLHWADGYWTNASPTLTFSVR
jgi:major membrane immunogen (membrane-anchored lipoprotein)